MVKENESYRKRAIEFVTEDKDLLKKLNVKITTNGGNESDVEDFYQQGIVKLVEQLNKGKYKGGAIRGYFFRICYNLWWNYHVHKHKPELYNEVPEPDPEEPNDPLSQLEIKEFKIKFYKAFLKLNERCRNIVTLKLFIRESFSMDEIAEMLGITKKTVENQLYQALKVLRQKCRDLL